MDREWERNPLMTTPRSKEIRRWPRKRSWTQKHTETHTSMQLISECRARIVNFPLVSADLCNVNWMQYRCLYFPGSAKDFRHNSAPILIFILKHLNERFAKLVQDQDATAYSLRKLVRVQREVSFNQMPTSGVQLAQSP